MRRLFLLFFVLLITELLAQNNTASNADEKKIGQLLDSADHLKYSNWKQSSQLISLADKLSEKANNEGLRALYYKKAALIFYDRDIFDISLKYNINAYDYYKNKDKGKASEIENVLAIINARLNQKETALGHFRNIYSYNKRIGNRELASKALNNIGTIYLDDNKVDSALYNYQKSVKELGDLNNINLKITINANIARVLAEKNNPKAAEHFAYVESLLKLTKDPFIHTMVYGDISEYYYKEKNALLAIKYAELAKSYSSVKLSFTNRDVLQNLYKAYLLGGNYKLSAEYFQQYDNIRDSLNIEEKAVNVEREKIESNYRDKEQALELENNKKRLNLLYTILVLLVISFVLLFLIIRYKNNLYKEKIENELVASRENELKLELELKNKELVSKSLLETERTELYQSITNELKDIVSTDDNDLLKQNLNNVIFRLSRNNSTTNWDEFSLRFTNVYDSFYETLQELHPGLNHNDKRLCALIKLNLSSKEIADITKTSIKSVENSRTRLRKKLGLTNTKTELNQYLSEL